MPFTSYSGRIKGRLLTRIDLPITSSVTASTCSLVYACWDSLLNVLANVYHVEAL